MNYSNYVPNPPLIYSDQQLSNLSLNNDFSVSPVSLSAAQSWKLRVRATTTTNGTITTAFAAGQIIDGITLAVGDRILLKDQTDQKQNGIYNVTSTTPTRSADMAVGTNAGTSALFVDEGTVNGNLGFLCTNAYGVDIVGTSHLGFSSFSGGSALITASTGLVKSGNDIQIDTNYDQNFNSVTLAKNTATQVGGSTSAVVLNSACGKITTVSQTLAPQDLVDFVFLNNKITNSSVIVVTVNNYVGNGVPYITVSSISNGSCSIGIYNVGTSALTSPITFAFSIL